MAEIIQQQSSSLENWYDTSSAQDISGHFHYGVLSGGAYFPEEAFPSVCGVSTTNASGEKFWDYCPVTDPYPGYFQSGISTNPVWATGTAGQSCTGACLAVFQGDGNFVLYNGNTPYWATNTAEGEVSDPGAELQLVNVSPWVEVLNQQGSVSWHQ